MVRRRLAEFWPFDRQGTHALLALSVIITAFIFIVGLKAVFTPFFIALLLAYICNPIVNAGEKIAIPRWGTTFLIFIGFSLGILLFAFLLVPSFIHEFKELTTKSELLQGAPEKAINKFRKMAETHLSPEMQEKVVQQIKKWVETLEESGTLFKDTTMVMSKNIFFQASKIPGMVMNLVLIPFYMFFLLTSLNRIWSFSETYMIPYEYRDQFLTLLEKIHRSLSAFFRGRLLICMIIGVLCWIGFSFLGVPFPFIFGFAIGFATIIPLLGLVVLIPAAFFYLISGASFEYLIYLTIFYTVIQGLEMLILTPFILGKEVELPPIILVLSLFIFGHLFGTIGVILAVPFASTVKILFYEFIFPSFVELSKKRPHSPSASLPEESSSS